MTRYLESMRLRQDSLIDKLNNISIKTFQVVVSGT